MGKIPFETRFSNGVTLEADHLNDMVDEIEKKQNTLISGENIKTINGQSLLGSGNITIIGDGSGGNLSAMTIQDTAQNHHSSDDKAQSGQQIHEPETFRDERREKIVEKVCHVCLLSLKTRTKKPPLLAAFIC